MSKHKTSLYVTDSNWEKLQTLIAETGMSQTDLINQFISQTPIINIGNQKVIAESFFEI